MKKAIPSASEIVIRAILASRDHCEVVTVVAKTPQEASELDEIFQRLAEDWAPDGCTAGGRPVSKYWGAPDWRITLYGVSE